MIDKVSYKDIEKAFKGVKQVITGDENYLVPSKEWFDNDFFPWHEKVVKLLKAKVWKDNHDCDDKSDGFKWLASVCNGQRTGDTPEGIAVGEISYRPDSGGAHRINVAIVGSNHDVMFIEPQTASWVELSAEEVASIYLVYF